MFSQKKKWQKSTKYTEIIEGKQKKKLKADGTNLIEIGFLKLGKTETDCNSTDIWEGST